MQPFVGSIKPSRHNLSRPKYLDLDFDIETYHDHRSKIIKRLTKSPDLVSLGLQKITSADLVDLIPYMPASLHVLDLSQADIDLSVVPAFITLLQRGLPKIKVTGTCFGLRHINRLHEEIMRLTRSNYTDRFIFVSQSYISDAARSPVYQHYVDTGMLRPNWVQVHREFYLDSAYTKLLQVRDYNVWVWSRNKMRGVGASPTHTIISSDDEDENKDENDDESEVKAVHSSCEYTLSPGEDAAITRIMYGLLIPPPVPQD